MVTYILLLVNGHVCLIAVLVGYMITTNLERMDMKCLSRLISNINQQMLFCVNLKLANAE